MQPDDRRVFDCGGFGFHGHRCFIRRGRGCRQRRRGRFSRRLPGNGRLCLGLDLLGGMLRLDPRERLSAAEALEHPWFDEFPRATERALMPTFPESGRR